MNLTHVWNQTGFPEVSAIAKAEAICSRSFRTSRSGTAPPVYTWTCGAVWAIGSPLFVLARLDGQTQTTVTVHTSLADAQAGTGKIAEYVLDPVLLSELLEDGYPAPWEASLVQVDAEEPDLGGYAVLFMAHPNLPDTSGLNALWSIYSTPELAQAVVELQVCEAIVEALQARTGDGEALTGVDLIDCGPPPDGLPAADESIRVTVGQVKRAEDVAEIGQRHRYLDVAITVSTKGHKNPGVLQRRAGQLRDRVRSIVLDEDLFEGVFRMRHTTSPPAETPGSGVGRAVVEFEADLLTESRE